MIFEGGSLSYTSWGYEQQSKTPFVYNQEHGQRILLARYTCFICANQSDLFTHFLTSCVEAGLIHFSLNYISRKHAWSWWANSYYSQLRVMNKRVSNTVTEARRKASVFKLWECDLPIMWENLTVELKTSWHTAQQTTYCYFVYLVGTVHVSTWDPCM